MSHCFRDDQFAHIAWMFCLHNFRCHAWWTSTCVAFQVGCLLVMVLLEVCNPLIVIANMLTGRGLHMDNAYFGCGVHLGIAEVLIHLLSECHSYILAVIHNF